jgi:outer membrane immunogenic protein
MQKTILAATLAAALGMGGTAYAADLNGGSLKDAPYVPETSWTGFYLGVGGGGAMTNDDLKLSDTHKRSSTNSGAEVKGLGGEGGFGTVQVGYDRQFGGFVAGVFFDYDFDSVNGDITANVGKTSYKASWSLNDSWSAGGRLGYLVNPSTLAYALAAYTEANYSLPKGLSNPTRDGYTVGAGLETKLGGNWFVKAEYRFTDLNTVTLYDKTHNNTTVKLTDQADEQTGRLVLSYKADIFGHDLTPLK